MQRVSCHEDAVIACTKSFSVSVSIVPPVFVLHQSVGSWSLPLQTDASPALKTLEVAHRSRCSS